MKFLSILIGILMLTASVLNADQNQPKKTGFKKHCDCAAMGFTGQFILRMVLDEEGNYDELGNYETQAACDKELRKNPACTK